MPLHLFEAHPLIDNNKTIASKAIALLKVLIFMVEEVKRNLQII
jgi:hypothetical protein